MVKASSKFTEVSVKAEVKDEFQKVYEPGIFIKLLGYFVVVIVWLLDKVFSLLPRRKASANDSKMWWDELETDQKNEAGV